VYVGTHLLSLCVQDFGLTLTLSAPRKVTGRSLGKKGRIRPHRWVRRMHTQAFWAGHKSQTPIASGLLLCARHFGFHRPDHFLNVENFPVQMRKVGFIE
jgi:hypothetical protein